MKTLSTFISFVKNKLWKKSQWPLLCSLRGSRKDGGGGGSDEEERAKKRREMEIGFRENDRWEIGAGGEGEHDIFLLSFLFLLGYKFR